MRLIDAEILKSSFEIYCHLVEKDSLSLSEIKKFIDEQPTAFDKEKVLKEMKDSQKYYEKIGDSAFTIGKVAGIYESIQIFKDGGKE